MKKNKKERRENSTSTGARHLWKRSRSRLKGIRYQRVQILLKLCNGDEFVQEKMDVGKPHCINLRQYQSCSNFLFIFSLKQIPHPNNYKHSKL